MIFLERGFLSMLSHPRGTFLLRGLLGMALLALMGCQPASHGTSYAASTPSYALTYVAIGASDAFGIGTDDPADESWPTVLAGELSGDTHLVNLGIPGATVAEALTAEVPIALEAQPSIATVWLVVDDYNDNVPLATYSQQLRDLLAALAQGTHARIYVGNMPDLTLLPYFAGRDQDQLKDDATTWNAAIAQDCAATGAHLVDIYTDFAVVADHPEYLSGDGLHPSAEGAAQLASYFAAAIRNG
jgi:lysophospholipase L1-like esterase